MKFKLYEIALTRRATINGSVPAGSEVEVIAVGPWNAGERITVRGSTGILDDHCEYIVATRNGFIPCDEGFLRKRPEHGIPIEVLRLFEQPLKVSA